MEDPGAFKLTVEEPSQSWVLRVSDDCHLRLDALGWGPTLNLLSRCCSSWVEWLTPPAKLVCGKCREETWTLLDVSDPARSHYCLPGSSLLLTWCELALDPLDAELVAAEIHDIVRGLVMVKHE